MLQTLPAYYMITGKFADPADFQSKLERALRTGPRVVQLRCNGAQGVASTSFWG